MFAFNRRLRSLSFRQSLRAIWLSHRVTFSREGLYYLFVVLAVFAGSIVRDSNLMLLLGGMLAGPLLLSAWFVLRGLRHVEVRRLLPQSVCAGESLVVELTCSNRRRRLASWALVVEDAFSYQGPLAIRRPAPARVLFPFVRPGETCHTLYEGKPPVRGHYVFGPLHISTRFPLGLLKHRRTLDDRATLLVWPRLGRLVPGGLNLEQRSEMGTQRTQRRQARREADFYGLRDWRSGDSRRWIHWRSSARRGQVVVRQFDESRSQDLSLFVDLCPNADEHDTRQRGETAISFAATLLADICRHGGRRLALHVAGEQSLDQQGWASAALLRELLDGLAVARPRRAEQLPAGFVEKLAEIQPPLTALIISTRPLDLESIWRDQQRTRIATGTIQVIDVGSDELARYFEPLVSPAAS